jgi:hypothetical protein
VVGIETGADGIGLIVFGIGCCCVVVDEGCAVTEFGGSCTPLDAADDVDTRGAALFVTNAIVAAIMDEMIAAPAGSMRTKIALDVFVLCQDGSRRRIQHRHPNHPTGPIG